MPRKSPGTVVTGRKARIWAGMRPSTRIRARTSSAEQILTSRSRSSITTVSTCAAEQPHRSDFQNFNVSPGRSSARAADAVLLVIGTRAER